MVRNSLGDEEKEKFINFLKANLNVFAWKPDDMPGNDAEVMCHRLHIDKKFKPVKKKSMRTSPKKQRM